MKTYKIKPMCAAIALATMTASAFAEAIPGAVEFGGYIRAGIGNNSSKGQQACYGLEGAGGKYRLGNECDFFTEFTFGYTLPKAGDGATFKAVVMPGLQFVNFNGDPNGATTTYVRQAYVEGSGIPELGGASVWAGRRFYKRNNYYPLDYFYWNDALTGAGVDNIALFGKSKLSYALSRSNGTAPGVNDSATRHEFQVSDIMLGAGARLNAGLSLVSKDSSNPDTSGGYAASLQYVQSFAGATENKLTLQYGRGGGVEVGFVGNQGIGKHDKGDTRARLVDELFYQLTGKLSGQANFIYQRDNFLGVQQTWTSMGTRLNYALTPHIKLVGDIGHDIVKPEAGPQRKLTKITIAPALSLGSGYWDRPSIYAYYTYAKWNDAARAAAGAGSALSGSGAFGGANHGATLGVQLEAWW